MKRKKRNRELLISIYVSAPGSDFYLRRVGGGGRGARGAGALTGGGIIQGTFNCASWAVKHYLRLIPVRQPDSPTA